MSAQHQRRMKYLEGKANLSRPEKSELSQLHEMAGMVEPEPVAEPEPVEKSPSKKESKKSQ